jgi:hypothetical protein
MKIPHVRITKMDHKLKLEAHRRCGGKASEEEEMVREGIADHPGRRSPTSWAAPDLALERQWAAQMGSEDVAGSAAGVGRDARPFPTGSAG